MLEDPDVVCHVYSYLVLHDMQADVLTPRLLVTLLMLNQTSHYSRNFFGHHIH